MSAYMVFEAHLQPDHASSFPGAIKEKLRDVYQFEGFEGVVKCWQDSSDPGHYLMIERWASADHHRRYLAWRAERGERMSLSLFSEPIRVGYFNDADDLFLPESGEAGT